MLTNACSNDSTPRGSPTSTSGAVATSSSPQSAPSSTQVSHEPTPRGTAFSAPSSIAADCSVDVSAALAAWLQSVPNGSTILLAKNGCYRIETTLELRDRHDLVVEGNNATLRAFTAGTGSRLVIRGRSQLAIVGSSNVMIRDLVVRGANPNAGSNADAYQPALEAQHAFVVNGDDHVVLDHVQAYDVYGDFVYIGAAEGSISSHVTVTGSRFARSGRQGISITNGNDVIITHNDIAGVARSLFDLEPNLRDGRVENVRIESNTTGAAVNFWLGNKGSGINIGDITVTGNVARAPTGGLIFVFGPAWGSRGPYRFVDNTFTLTGAVTDENSSGAFTFVHASGITVRGNRVTVASARRIPLVELRGASDVLVQGNRTAGISREVVADAASHNVDVAP
jgi:hypothetical protein